MQATVVIPSILSLKLVLEKNTSPETDAMRVTLLAALEEYFFTEGPHS